ncbi:uncharacterized protein L3040_001451 [Drepanopeziza brunnea f. sp. 'multigermtubi']|uniref:uncharacterized protein n=1 Tax=Drepanopeziza brunnea f. sp. 'multigermtubi' TaxID=698441 RepID=UPI002390B9C0|nr:hypothetical protein L3040_001451 [Drepanopeziza brunnea f. sp. 'multigermtubi']
MNGYPSENQQRNLQQMQDAAAAGGQYGGDSNIFSQIKDLYAPSGIDVLNILLAVKCRPNPQIDIGNIDSGVALVLCDADDLDNPIVYCSEPFMSLTGYDSADIIGKNCRFLQHPPGQKCADRDIISTNSAARRKSIGRGGITSSASRQTRGEFTDKAVLIASMRRSYVGAREKAERLLFDLSLRHKYLTYYKSINARISINRTPTRHE